MAGLAASVLLPVYALIAGNGRPGPAAGTPPSRLVAATELVDHALPRSTHEPRLSVESEILLATRARKLGLWPNAVVRRRLAVSLRRRLVVAYGSPEQLGLAMDRLGIDGGDLERIANQRAAVEVLISREIPPQAASFERIRAAYLYGGPWRSPEEVHVALGQPGPHGSTVWADLGWLPARSLRRTGARNATLLPAMDRDGILPIGHGHAILRILGRRPGHRLSEAEARARIRRELLAQARSHAARRLLADVGLGKGAQVRDSRRA